MQISEIIEAKRNRILELRQEIDKLEQQIDTLEAAAAIMAAGDSSAVPSHRGAVPAEPRKAESAAATPSFDIRKNFP